MKLFGKGLDLIEKSFTVPAPAVGESTQQRPAWIGRTFVFAGISP